MFYSHTFLARKGPLGTVWCAAHSHCKLKKSYYTSTDIASTVERIMFPEVPMALRMSGQLLFGVVRIYSMKHKDLRDDYKKLRESLINACSLVEGATHAPFDSVTLPDTFELDAMDLDNDFCYEGNQDKYHKSFEEITLSCDQIPTRTDPYITINFDEDLLRRSSCIDDVFRSGPSPMQEGDAPSETMDHSSSINPTPRTINDIFPDIIPEFEILRENNTVWSAPSNDVLPPDTYIEEQIIKDKEPSISVVEETLFEGEVDFSPQHFHTPVNSPVSENAADVVLPNISLGKSLNLELNPSPPNDKPKGGPRKRKQRYDEVTVLTNKVIKAALDNCNDILRKKKRHSSSFLDVWKSYNKILIFSEPLITGLSQKLRNIYDDNVISSKPCLLAEPTNAHYEEIESLRNYERPVDNSVIPDGIYENIFNSPRDNDDFTPAEDSRIGSTQRETTMETPFTCMQEHTWFDNTSLSPIPEDMGSAEVDDLNFLASEDYTPTDFKITEGLSGATRKVAQYLKEKYSPISEALDGDLSMNQLLEGKTRKVSARMLFETLVLKCGGLVDLEQEEAYGDIKLKLTLQLFKD